jgi:hypothetical protein
MHKKVQQGKYLPLGKPVVDTEGLQPDACLAKVVAAARHFVEQVEGALAKRAPHRWRHKTVAVEQVA